MVHPYEDSDSSEDEVDWQDTRHDPTELVSLFVLHRKSYFYVPLAVSILLPDCIWFTISDKPTTTPKKGFVGKGKNITTKHDEDICGRKNTARMDNVRLVHSHTLSRITS